IPAELTTYYPDRRDRQGCTHLVIGQCVASTIAELSTTGRPAILITLPISTDDHQTENMPQMVAAVGARAIGQQQFIAQELAKQMQKMALGPDALANAARCARKCGRPDAASDLADLVESIGTSPLAKTLKVQPETPQAATGQRPALAKESIQ